MDSSSTNLNISQGSEMGPIARKIQEAKRRQANIFKKGKNREESSSKKSQIVDGSQSLGFSENIGKEREGK